MNPPRSPSPRLRSRTAGLLASVTVAAGLLVGATSAQAKPGGPPVDFLMEASATSATFTPVAGAPGEYRLVLRGVPSTVGVFELTKAEVSASLPTRAFMAYWTEYGDETGQFTRTPPRAVLRAADGSGGGEEVVVRLRDGSQKGTTLRFDAEVISNPAVWNQLELKVDRVDETTPPDQPSPDLEPTALTNVEMFVDMPRTITQPRAKRPAPGITTTPSARRSENQNEWRDWCRQFDDRGWSTGVAPCESHTNPQQWMPNGGTCNGVRSSRLRNCWGNIPNFCRVRVGSMFRNFVNGSGFAYDRVGVVDLGNYFFRAGDYGLGRADPMDHQGRFDRSRCFGYYSEGWYGVGPGAVTFYTTDRCTWFLAKWSTNGRCW
ncbi:MAG: hypothetical protein ISP32_02855 [Thermoleophilia bacterium]|nr:hypothetical protein [Thermoleophilia bacterium]